MNPAFLPRRRLLQAGAASAAALALPVLHAQTWPTKNVRFVVVQTGQGHSQGLGGSARRE